MDNGLSSGWSVACVPRPDYSVGDNDEVFCRRQVSLYLSLSWWHGMVLRWFLFLRSVGLSHLLRIIHQNSTALFQKEEVNNCGVKLTFIHWLVSPLPIGWWSGPMLAIWSVRLAKDLYQRRTLLEVESKFTTPRLYFRASTGLATQTHPLLGVAVKIWRGWKAKWHPSWEL